MTYQILEGGGGPGPFYYSIGGSGPLGHPYPPFLDAYELSLSRQLQLDSTQTLEKTTKAVRQREAVTSQQNILVHDNSIPDLRQL